MKIILLIFDDKEKVVDVTGIVGENGAGKTTVLNLIKDIFSQNGVSTEQKYIIAFTKQNKTKEIYIFIMTYYWEK